MSFISTLLFYVALSTVYLNSSAFKAMTRSSSLRTKSFMTMTSGKFDVLNFSLLKQSFSLADTSISEEDVLGVVGQSQELPSPIFAIVFAAIVFLGVAALQFSLGDLTKEEGQARVRDFLQTKRDTERKRGYFD